MSVANSVNMAGDGLGLQPREYAGLLAKLTGDLKVEPDYYCRGGVVDRFEQKAAQALGKEDALILPSGTMANLLALEYLGGQGCRIPVQHDSHIYLDSGDAVQALGGMNLLPMCPGRMPKLEDLRRTLDMYPGDKVEVPVKVLHLESPVRRLHEAAFDLAEFDRLTAFARAAGMGLHLDGARLFLWSAWCGRTPKELARPFDTVYVSLYKYFNTLFGAVLAGPGEMISRLRHRRRRNGGALAQIWPVALVANHFMPGFGERLARAKEASDRVLEGLDALPGLAVKPVENGTNTSLLHIAGAAPDQAEALRKRLMQAGVKLPAYQEKDRGFWVRVNETWNNREPEDVVQAFESALRAETI